MLLNKEEILSLSPEEKIALAEELWSSVEEEMLPVTNDEILFAKQRLQMHEANPEEGMNLENFKKYFSDKYVFDLIIKPIVFVDVEEAISFYETKSDGLAARFYQSFLNAIETSG